MPGTRLTAPPETTIVGLPARHLEAARLIWSDVTESILAVYSWKVRFPKVWKFLAISSRRSPEFSRAIMTFIFKRFLALLSSASWMGSLSLLSSSTATWRSSAEWDPGPSTLIPKRPESVKWELMHEAPSMNPCCYIRLVTALQYMPLPGPPEENAVADPMRVFMR